MNLNERVQEILSLGSDMEDESFLGEVLSDVSGGELEFSGCTFERCTFLPCYVRRFCFVDTVFDRCDVSNMPFPKATFQRCTFKNCRMDGVGLAEAVLMNTCLQGCHMRYANFSGCKLNRADFQDCCLDCSAFLSVQLKNTKLNRCSMREAEWSNTPLKDMDLRTCDICGLITDIASLRGVLVTEAQALILSRLMGLRIKEEDRPI